VKTLFFTFIALLSFVLSGCSGVSSERLKPQESKPTLKTPIETKKTFKLKNATPSGYKLLNVEELKISLLVPNSWKTHRENRDGEWRYFIGVVKDFPEARMDEAEIWDTFEKNRIYIHGVRMESIDGSPKSIDSELINRAPRHRMIKDEDLSSKTLTIRSVLKKSEESGYYQFYAIGSKSENKRGLVLEMASKVYEDGDGNMRFDDLKDKKEMQIVIQSVTPHKDF